MYCKMMSKAAVCLLGLVVSSVAAQTVPQLMNYQGRLRQADGTPVADGTVSISFALHATASGGTALWSQTQNVALTGGLFHTLLGSGGSPLTADLFPAGADRYIAVTYDGNELTPRQQIVTVPFALRADSVSPGSVDSTSLASDFGSLAQVSGGVLNTTSDWKLGIGSSTGTPYTPVTPEAGLDFRFRSGSDIHTAAQFKFSGAGGSRFDLVRDSTANSQQVRTFAIQGGNDYDAWPYFSLGMVSNHGVAFMTNNTRRMYILANGRVGIGNSNPTHLLDVGTSGAYCDGGAWINGSSREYKQDIEPLDSEQAVQCLNALEPVTFAYKSDPDQQQVGFIAEDVPELVATKDRKGLTAMDIVAVLTKVVQRQQTENEQLRQELDQLRADVDQLKAAR